MSATVPRSDVAGTEPNLARRIAIGVDQIENLFAYHGKLTLDVVTVSPRKLSASSRVIDSIPLCYVEPSRHLMSAYG